MVAFFIFWIISHHSLPHFKFVRWTITSLSFLFIQTIFYVTSVKQKYQRTPVLKFCVQQCTRAENMFVNKMLYREWIFRMVVYATFIPNTNRFFLILCEWESPLDTLRLASLYIPTLDDSHIVSIEVSKFKVKAGLVSWRHLYISYRYTFKNIVLCKHA